MSSIQYVLRVAVQLNFQKIRIFPARHHVTSEDRLKEACLQIERELRSQMTVLKREGSHVEASRLQQRVMNDLLLLRETGFCSGLEVGYIS